MLFHQFFIGAGDAHKGGAEEHEPQLPRVQVPPDPRAPLAVRVQGIHPGGRDGPGEAHAHLHALTEIQGHRGESWRHSLEYSIDPS